MFKYVCQCVLGRIGAIDCISVVSFFFQAEDGIRDLVRSRGLGDVYKRQVFALSACATVAPEDASDAPMTYSCGAGKRFVASYALDLSLIHI